MVISSLDCHKVGAREHGRFVIYLYRDDRVVRPAIAAEFVKVRTGRTSLDAFLTLLQGSCAGSYKPHGRRRRPCRLGSRLPQHQEGPRLY
jgi:hypothetical protein